MNTIEAAMERTLPAMLRAFGEPALVTTAAANAVEITAIYTGPYTQDNLGGIPMERPEHTLTAITQMILPLSIAVGSRIFFRGQDWRVSAPPRPDSLNNGLTVIPVRMI